MIIRFAYSIPTLFYFLFFFTPLIFITKTSEIFEFNKIVFVYASTVIIVTAWAIRMILVKKIIFRRTLLNIPLLLFLASQILSTIFSLDTRTSIFGYYYRFNGGLLSLVSYCLLYWAYVSNLSKENTKKVIYSLLASAYLVSAYAFLQRIGVDKDFWDQDVQSRVFATFGQPNWLAAWIASVIPLTWVYIFFNLKDKKFWLSLGLFILFFLTILFTKSRSGLLGFVFSYIIFWGTLLFIKGKKVLKHLALLTSLILLVTLFIGTPWTPSGPEALHRTRGVHAPAVGAGGRKIPSNEIASSPSDPGGTESGEIRKIVWKGAIKIWQFYPIFGSGVETFAYSYPSFKPPQHNLTSEWEYIYNKAHNEYLNYAATTGAFGLITYLILIGGVGLLFLKKNLKKLKFDIWNLSFMSGFASLLVTNFFGFSTVATSLMFFLYPAVAGSLAKSRLNTRNLNKFSNFQRILLLLVLSLMFYILSLLARYWYADFLYAKGRLENQKGQYAKAIQNLSHAINLSPNEPIYYDELAHAYTQSAIYLYDVDRSFGIEELIDAAIYHSSYAIELSPKNLNLFKSRARLFINIALVEPKYLSKAIDSLVISATLAPTDAKVLYDLALALARTGDKNEAIIILEKTVALKPDFRDARFTLALLYREKLDIDKAKSELREILIKNPNDIFAQEQLEELSR